MKPWYKVVTPRADLRANRPLDASEFAVHLDHVRTGKAPDYYCDAHQFFDRTFLTGNLQKLAVEVLRRLSGIVTETSAVFNMSTQFGGGKTHALTLLYHLAKSGHDESFTGVPNLLQSANIQNVPKCKTAVFVGTEFDSLTGRGGNDGTPLRKTPWGEIAWQIGGENAFKILEQHDKNNIAPAGDVLNKIFPENEPALILMDEIMNFVSRSVNKEAGKQFYNFLQILSEFVRSRSNIVLAVSVPASDLELNPEELGTFDRIKKLLDRLGKAVIMSVESETSEIIRRRLFEWDNNNIKKEAKTVAQHYETWIQRHRQQLPQWFPIDNAARQFEATYPFHPTVISVFERKWQSLPRFQRTRGILRLLALWVADAYEKGFQQHQSDLLISLGSAPLENSNFRTALFEQLGATNLEVAVTTDIVGKDDSHSIRLDKDANDNIRKMRLHQKIATSIFFESNGGQTHDVATEPEIRLDVADPDLDIGNIETSLESLCTAGYYLLADNKKYRFSVKPNLNKLLADRRASVDKSKINERIQSEIKKVLFPYEGVKVKLVFFPEKSIDIYDEPVLTFVILPPDQNREDWETVERRIDKWTRERGDGVRRFRNALVWVVAESDSHIQDNARDLLAWETIRTEFKELRLEENEQRYQLEYGLKKAQRDLTEAIWRTYKNISYLNQQNKLQTEDLGLVTSSSSESLLRKYIDTMCIKDDATDCITTNFLIRNWATALTEWSTKSIKEVFFASPKFPRLLKPEAVLDMFKKGVAEGCFAYVGNKTKDGKYEPFRFKEIVTDIEISDDMYIIRQETAEEYLKNWQQNSIDNTAADKPEELTKHQLPENTSTAGYSQNENPRSLIREDDVYELTWSGKIPHQKWTSFYSKVLSKLVQGNEITLNLQLSVTSNNGISQQTIKEINSALRELGLENEIS
ncbi:MAG: DUF499 domain-containing protein [Planctomycetaceae bacterium]|jgi:hypothetical protein|nr:DUF499 domain-containing protein [Planctomycetaceae bacterium]